MDNFDGAFVIPQHRNFDGTYVLGFGNPEPVVGFRHYVLYSDLDIQNYFYFPQFKDLKIKKDPFIRILLEIIFSEGRGTE